MNVKLTIIENGPALLEVEDAGLFIETPVGMSIPKEDGLYPKKVAICRCAKSANNPWCDGSHSKSKN